MLWFSNEPTPTQPRPRIYTITCDNDLTAEEFDLHYKWAIRNINSHWPECKFYISGISNIDAQTENFLRNIGVSPARVTIYYLCARNPVNNYQSALRGFDNIHDLERTIVAESTHDINWTPDGIPDGITVRVRKARAEKEKITPYTDTMPMSN